MAKDHNFSKKGRWKRSVGKAHRFSDIFSLVKRSIEDACQRLGQATPCFDSTSVLIRHVLEVFSLCQVSWYEWSANPRFTSVAKDKRRLSSARQNTESMFIVRSGN